MATGKVKWFNFQKGYGFIVPDAGGNDLFVHVQELRQTGLDCLQENQRVEFTEKQFNGKTSAAGVKLI